MTVAYVDTLIDRMIAVPEAARKQSDLSPSEKGAVTRLVNEWRKTDQFIRELRNEMEPYEKARSDLALKLFDALKTLDSQRYRVGTMVVRIAQRNYPTYAAPFKEAIQILSEVSPEMAEQAKELQVQSENVRDEIRIEAELFGEGIGAKVMSWLNRFTNRLRKNDHQIAQAEKLLYFDATNQ